MPFERVKPDDMAQVTSVAMIEEAARRVDDPDDFPPIPEILAGDLRYGWDLEPEERYLYTPADAADPVGALALDMPTRDNLHLMWAHIVVHPDHRRRGHGSAIMNEAMQRAREAGRNTIWVGTGEDDQGARRFVERFGFSYASHDARRRQVLADVDQTEVQRLGPLPRPQRPTTVLNGCDRRLPMRSSASCSRSPRRSTMRRWAI